MSRYERERDAGRRKAARVLGVCRQEEPRVLGRSHPPSCWLVVPWRGRLSRRGLVGGGERPTRSAQAAEVPRRPSRPPAALLWRL